MNIIYKVALSSIVVMMLVGCASNDTVSKAEMVSVSGVVFPYEAEITGTITYSSKNACNESEFLLYAREKEKVHRVYDIIMADECTGGFCSCKYSGIGIKYRYNGNLEVEKSVERESEKNMPLTEKKMGTKVKLNSNPEGAVVYVNGHQMKNPTPTILFFNKGKNNIRMLLDGVQKDTTIYIDGSESYMEIDMSL